MPHSTPESARRTSPLRGLRAAGTLMFLAALLLLTQGCATQATYNSPDKAVDSLVTALRTQNPAQLHQVLGPSADEIASSGDKVADQNLRDNFLKAYDQKHQLVPAADGTMTLIVGNADWPMPIPIVETAGKWRFDTAAGKEEILNRRIGRDELSAIETCLAILDAQREYVSHDRNANGLCEYATRFISTPGQKDGLFWPTAANEPPSPLGPLVAAAAEEGYTHHQPTANPQPFHGYMFRMLTSQGQDAPGGALDYMVKAKLIGGFAIVAWPANYGNSGIMTFIMNHDGIVYQRDLGPDTSKIADAMKAYDPSPEWQKVATDKQFTKE